MNSSCESPNTGSSFNSFSHIAVTVLIWISMHDNSSFTKITVRGVGGFPSLSTGRCALGSGVHLTGLSDGRHQVLVIRIPPAPPTNLRLAATCNHCAVPLMPEIQSDGVINPTFCELEKTLMLFPLMCQHALPVDHHRDPLPRPEGSHTLQLLISDPYWNQKLLRVAGAQSTEIMGGKGFSVRN